MTTGNGLPYEGQTFEGWETGSGLLDNEDITITGATFAYRSEYNGGQTLVLVLDWQTPDGETGEQFLPCGKGWTFAPGGNEMVHESGKPKRVNGNTAYGEWLNRAVKLAGPALAQRGPATHASVWTGTMWHVVSEEREFPQKPVNGQPQPPLKRNSLVPAAYLGLAGTQATLQPQQVPQPAMQQAPVQTFVPPQPAAQPQPVPGMVAQAPQMAPMQAPVAQAVQSSNGIDPALVAALQQCAVQSPDQTTFANTGYTIPGVQGNPAAEALLLDDAFYAQARAAAGVQ